MNAPRFDRRQLLRLLGIGASSFAAAPLLSSCAGNPASGSRRLMMLSQAEEISPHRCTLCLAARPPRPPPRCSPSARTTRPPAAAS